ncbi:MAG: BrxE family protein, partial [Syntrophales bacterium]
MSFDPGKANQSLDQFALLRLVVGYLGQRKQSGWWDCDFMDATGIRFLEATFPRTACVAALRSTTEAACIVHDQALGRVGNFHLFLLPPTLEDQFEHALDRI